MNIEKMVDIVERYPSISSRIYERINAGFFLEENHPEFDLGFPLNLSPSERLINMEIGYQLEHNHVVNMVGVGEMLAASLVIIGIHRKKEIEAGLLKIFATNVEADFDVDILLQEAERRLQLQNVYLQLKQLPKDVSDQYSDTVDWLIDETRPIVSEPMIDLIRQNCNRLIYLPGVDTAGLNSVFGSSSLQIMHEHVGGLKRHPRKHNAIDVLTDLLSPNGVLFTLEHLDEPPYSYNEADFERLGLTIHDEMMVPYNKLSRRSPMRDRYRAYVKER